ncbi:MAG TPA: acyl-CoA dehydrogenase family protein [Pseudolysinimonas sp.]|jgi:alkylation response protein AidB-like acyl-CoA dehydrogenase
MSPEEYRQALLAWRDNALERVGDAAIGLDEQRENGRSLLGSGLAGPSWSVEYGGAGGGQEHERIFEEVLGDHSVLLPPRLVTLGICAPTVLEFGSDEQRRRYLPGMLGGSEIWAQLLSEPGAGSDLASVSTRARRVPGGWSLSGQKVWTSRADVAQYAVALVRTGDPSSSSERRRTLTMMIVDMSAAGIDVRPLREMTGEALFNEVFLDDVQVADDQVLGAVDDGWRVLLGMLRHERDAVGATGSTNTMYAARGPQLAAALAPLDEVARAEYRHELVGLVARERAHLAMAEAIAAARRDLADQRPFGSLTKISMSMLSGFAAELSARVEGSRLRMQRAGSALDGAAYALLKTPMSSIAGGTSEVQKNTIAKQLLHLKGARR